MSTYQNIIKSIKGPQDCYNRRIELIKEIEALTNRNLLVYVANVNKPDSI